MFWVDLDCGRKVYVTDLIYDSTYAGLEVGSPNEVMNRRLIKDAIHRVEKVWGKSKVHLIPPRIDRTRPSRPALPAETWTALLHSTEPVRGLGYCSGLVVIWFADPQPDATIPQVLSAGLRDLPWNELAEDYDP